LLPRKQFKNGIKSPEKQRCRKKKENVPIDERVVREKIALMGERIPSEKGFATEKKAQTPKIGSGDEGILSCRPKESCS
jgi:hypothetical protein